MKKLLVETIIVPMAEGVSLEPCVTPQDRMTEAVEVMVKNDVKCIAVVEQGKVLGMIQLKDALEQVGLHREQSSKKPQSFVVHGRKIVVD